VAESVTITYPLDGALVASDLSLTVTWSISEPGSPAASLCRFRYRPYGASTWTHDESNTDLNQATIAANTLTPGTWEVERTWRPFSSTLVSPVSDSVVFSTGPTSPTPTVSAPTSPITNPAETVTWSTSPTDQVAYQVQVLDGSTVVFDTGEVSGTAQTLAGVPFPDTGVTRVVRVRTRRSAAYVWSQWGSTGSLTVTHLSPPTPTLTLAPADVAAVGLDHALVATITNPAPSGGEPSVDTTEVYVRRDGDTGGGALVATTAGTLSSYTYRSPASGVLYQMRVRVVTDDGRNASSAWVTATGAVTLKGVVMHSLAAPDDVHVFRLNGEEASDEYQPEADLIQYDGRAFPVVEFGTSASQVLKVRLSLKFDSGDADALVTMLRSRTLLLYRDRRARKMYAYVQATTIQDTAYGYEVDLTVTHVDNPDDRTD